MKKRSYVWVITLVIGLIAGFLINAAITGHGFLDWFKVGQKAEKTGTLSLEEINEIQQAYNELANYRDLIYRNYGIFFSLGIEKEIILTQNGQDGIRIEGIPPNFDTLSLETITPFSGGEELKIQGHLINCYCSNHPPGCWCHKEGQSCVGNCLSCGESCIAVYSHGGIIKHKSLF